MNRQISLMGSIGLLLLSAGAPRWIPAAEPLRALQRYPVLAETFPFGFWYAQAPMDEQLAGALLEMYPQRREKLFHHLARHYTNAVITSNRVARTESLDAAGRYGIRIVSLAQFLHNHVNHAGELTGNATMEQVLQRAAAHASEVKGHDQLLAYLVFDEPRSQVSAKIQQVSDMFQKIDPRHPAIYTHSDMPLDETQRAAQWRLLQSRDVILSDCYSIAARSGRDPWLYGDVYLSELRRANPDALQWPIVQAFTKPYTIWALPTPAELRVIVYHTVACGAKGMFFFTTNQAYLGSWARRHGFYRGSGNPWFGQEPLMAEIGRIGAHLTTAGPLLIPLRYAPKYPVDIGAVEAPTEAAETFGAYVLGGSGAARGGSLRLAGELRREAIHVGAFAGDAHDVLVVHNNDPWRSRWAAVTLRKPRDQVLDLHTLELVPLERTATGATFRVAFQPGDGRLYLAGDQRSVKIGRAFVLRRRYQHQARLVARDVEVVKRGGVDTAEVERLAGVARTAEDPQVAVDRIHQAVVALEQAQAAAQKYAQAWHHVEAARCSFDRIYATFCSAPIQPIDEQSAPALRELERRVLQASRGFARIENGLRAGKWDPTEAYVLEREVGQLETAVREYRPDERVELRIAVISGEAGQTGTDPEARALAKRLHWMFTEVTLLMARSDGQIVDAAGNPFALVGQDLVWFHISGRSDAARVVYCESAALVPGQPHRAVVEQVRDHNEGGGGVVLSGLAGCLVVALGWEECLPNDRYWGTMLVPDHGPSRHRSAAPPAVKLLGIRPLRAEHPLFAGLPAEGFSTMEYNAAELVTAAVWHRPLTGTAGWRAPFWPQRGTVLAGYWADGLEILADYAVMVEYRQPGRGRGLLWGGGFDPRVSTERPRRGPHYDQLIRNLVGYLVGRP